MAEKPGIALALASGGARGLAHIGVIEALEERGYAIRAIAGTSMGAVVGGIYAAGNLPQFKDWMLRLDENKVYDLIDLTLSAQGFVKGDRVFNEIKKFCGNPTLEDLHIPFVAVAADVKSLQKVEITSGDLFTALRASVAIPSVLTPLERNNQILVDGGVVDPIPLASLPASDASLVCAVDLNANVPSQLKAPEKPSNGLSGWNKLMRLALEKTNPRGSMSLFDLVNHSFDLMQQTLSAHLVEKYHPDLLVQVSKTSATTFAFHQARELIDLGHRLTHETLDTFEKNNT